MNPSSLRVVNAAFLRYGIVAVVLTLFSAPASAAAQSERAQVEKDGVRLSARARTPDQIAAFYGARGFPQHTLAVLRRACFLTVGIRNRSNRIVWLEPARWRLLPDRAGAAPVAPLQRPYWDAQWERLGVPLRARAGFRWSQLPASRDLRPGEPVGGNLTVDPIAGRFTLEARFVLGADRRGGELVIRLPGLSCRRGTEQ